MNHVLAVSINKYHPKFGDISLSMCHYDRARVESLLAHPESILTRMTDQYATGSEFINQINEIAQMAEAGDRVYIFFSGHGTYFDTPMGRKTGRVLYDRIVWDDEVVKTFRNFKKGCLVVFISDCCYAENNSRNALTPGVNDRFFEFNTKSGNAPTTPYQARLERVQCGLIMYSACSIVQTAKEITEVNPQVPFPVGGVFTTALEDIIKKNPQISFRDLRDRLTKKIPSFWSQTPKMEYVKARNLITQPWRL